MSVILSPIYSPLCRRGVTLTARSAASLSVSRWKVGCCSALSVAILPTLPPVCFTDECQSAVDQTSVVVIGIPLLVAALWIAYLLRPIPKDLLEKEKLFSDPDTGIVFQGEDGARPERDAKGELVFKAIGFTPWPVASEEQGERIRIDVGPLGQTQPWFSAPRLEILPFPSKLVVVTLARPLGIVFSEDRKLKRVLIEQIIPDSLAAQNQKVAQLSDASEMNAPMAGDVLRGITCTNFVYPTNALLGMNLPQKHIVVFGADGQPWRKCRSAFKGSPEDGDITVILERKL